MNVDVLWVEREERDLRKPHRVDWLALSWLAGWMMKITLSHYIMAIKTAHLSPLLLFENLIDLIKVAAYH